MRFWCLDLIIIDFSRLFSIFYEFVDFTRKFSVFCVTHTKISFVSNVIEHGSKNSISRKFIVRNILFLRFHYDFSRLWRLNFITIYGIFLGISVIRNFTTNSNFYTLNSLLSNCYCFSIFLKKISVITAHTVNNYGAFESLIPNTSISRFIIHSFYS